jgi:hypothetical protein
MGSPLLGYKRTLTAGVYELDPEVAPIVLELFERYAAGQGLRPLCAWFNARLGLPKPPPPGGKRGQAKKTPANLSKLLHNPSYKGINLTGAQRNSKLDGHYARPREEWDLVPSQSPAIVPPELWDAVQARLAQSKNVGQPERTKGVRYALSGLVWCTACQRRMAGHHSKGMYDEYVCGICGLSRSQRRVEAKVREALEMVPIGAQMIDAALARERADEHAAACAQLQDVEASLAALVARKVSLTTLLAEKRIDFEAYHLTLAQTEAELKELPAQRSALEQSVQQSTAAHASLAQTAAWLRTLSSWTALLDHATPEEERAIYRKTVARITIDAARSLA